MVDVTNRPADPPVSRGVKLAGSCSTCGLSTPDFNGVCPSCQGVGGKKMGRPRTRSRTPIHKTPGRSGYRLGCGCDECVEDHRAYHEAYNNRKRRDQRNAETADNESAA